MSKAARVPYGYNPAYISKEFAYNTGGIGTDAMVQVGTLPAAAIVSQTVVRIKTAFNAATTNVIIVGTAADNDDARPVVEMVQQRRDEQKMAEMVGGELRLQTPHQLELGQRHAAGADK